MIGNSVMTQFYNTEPCEDSHEFLQWIFEANDRYFKKNGCSLILETLVILDEFVEPIELSKLSDSGTFATMCNWKEFEVRKVVAEAVCTHRSNMVSIKAIIEKGTAENNEIKYRLVDIFVKDKNDEE